jgi:OmpA-OmpF porin, OOP family
MKSPKERESPPAAWPEQSQAPPLQMTPTPCEPVSGSTEYAFVVRGRGQEENPLLRQSHRLFALTARAQVSHYVRSQPALAAAAALITTFMLTSPAAAQSMSGEFSVQRFDPAVGPHNFITTRGVRMDGKMALSLGLMGNYAYKPFVVRSCISETDCSVASGREATRTTVIESLFSADLMGALTIIPRLQVSLRIPLTWVKGLGLNEQGQNSENGINTVGPGDSILEGKLRLYGEVNEPYLVGLGAFVTAPLGHLASEGSYVGDTLPSAGLRGIFDGELGPIGFGANLGAVFRDKGTVGSTTVGSEARYSVAAGYRVSPVVRIVMDFFGATRFSSNRGENSAELDGGLQVFPLGSPLTVNLGAGTGIIEGVGVPQLRAFAGVGYNFEKRDRDGDGLDDALDQCPTNAEDRDGYEDGDGCPEPDNDLDTVPDSADKCPDRAEDQDGFEDRDGCPEPDNDKDGVLDVSDRCPLQAETKNGFQDQDGCPDEVDKDSDGVPDSRDRCPDAAEDTDGFDDTDGCPDLDNDADGVPDADDECSDQPETKNGYEDQDGCPDEGPGKPTKKK